MKYKTIIVYSGILPLLLYSTLVYFDAYESAVSWSRQHTKYEVGNLFLLLPAVFVSMLATLILKYSELKSLKKMHAKEIIERKVAENKYRNLFDETPIIYVTVSDKNGVPVIDDVNKKFLDILGYTREEVIGKSISVFYTKASADAMLEGGGYQSALEGQFGERERGLVRKDGKILYTLAYSVPLKDPSGSTAGLRSMYIDITEMHRMETSVRRLVTAIEHLDETVMITDNEPKVLYVNPAFEKITGYTKDDIIGNNPSMLQSGRHSKQFYADMWDTLLKGRVWRGRFENIGKNGTIFVEDASISPVLDDLKNISNYVAVKRDVSREMELEKRLNQALKMEAIGTLAGGIAHDFNNILSSVIGFTELALDDTETGSPLQQCLSEVLAAGNRAKNLVKQILTFARQADEEIKPLQIELILKEALKLLRSTAPATIAFQTDIRSKSLVMADPTQIHQVIMNLLTNAVQAMNNKSGLLKVKLREQTINEVKSTEHANVPPGDYVKLSVIDTGHGISPENLDSIFEPYFTTKPPDAGTGLGLSTVYGIVKKYEGEVTVESQVDKGTSFHVLFPIAQNRNGDEQNIIDIIPHGTEKLLVIDDELAIANVSGRLLKSLGYNVTIRTSSIEALALFNTKPHAFDLIITDLTMPNMMGDQLAIELMKIQPDIPIIIVSGYSKTEIEKASLRLGIKAFVHKPLVKSELARIVRDVLDRALEQRSATVDQH